MPDLTDFQLKVTRLFFSLPASKGFLLAGGRLCSRSVSRHGLPKTWISSPPRTAATCPWRATRWKLRHENRAELPSAFTTATHSAGSSSGATQPKW